MGKKVKCSQCKYLRIPNSEAEKEHLSNMLANELLRSDLSIEEIFDPPEEKVILFGCEANKDYIFFGSAITKFKECEFFRKNTLTAWQEVWQDVCHFMPNLLKGIVNYFFKK